MRYPRKTSGAAIMKTITSARSTAMIGRPSVPRRRFLALSRAGMRLPLVQRDHPRGQVGEADLAFREFAQDRKSTRLNSSHLGISYAVFFLKKKSDSESKG